MDEICANYLKNLRWNRGIQICWLSFILGGIGAESEMFADIIKFPLFSSDDLSMIGSYFTKLMLGNPPQVFTVLVDTGSDLVWVNCPINATRSSYHMGSLVPCSEGKKPPCMFRVEYYDRSWVSGFYVSDALHYDTTFFRKNLSSNIVFGCSTERSGSLTKYGVEGVLGLGPGKNSIVTQLSSQHVAPQVFSHCLASSTGDGFLVLGHVLDSGLVYTPIVSRSRYEVVLESIAVNGELLDIDPSVFDTDHGTTVDLGAQISLLVAQAYDLLVDTVSAFAMNQSSYVGAQGLICYKNSSRFPQLRFNFHGNASLILWPRHYLIKNIYDAQGGSCINFRRAEALTVLGAPILSDKLMVYDLIHHRIGWVKHDCSKSVNVSLTYDKATGCILKMSRIMVAILAYVVSSIGFT